MTGSTRGRGWAYFGAILGGAVSIAANVAHSYVPPIGTADGWHPQPGAVVGSIFWPVFLFVAVEILARVTWPHGGWWALLRFGGLMPIAVVAGVVSYRHLSALLAFYGEDPLTAVIGPIAVDGLMVMATGALIVTGRNYTTKDRTTAQAATPVTAEQVMAEPVTDHPRPVPAEALLPTHLLPSARFAANQHQQRTGRAITAPELATAINIPTHTAQQLLSALGQPADPTSATALVATPNGNPVGAR